MKSLFVVRLGDGAVLNVHISVLHSETCHGRIATRPDTEKQKKVEGIRFLWFLVRKAYVNRNCVYMKVIYSEMVTK